MHSNSIVEKIVNNPSFLPVPLGGGIKKFIFVTRGFICYIVVNLHLPDVFKMVLHFQRIAHHQ